MLLILTDTSIFFLQRQESKRSLVQKSPVQEKLINTSIAVTALTIEYDAVITEGQQPNEVANDFEELFEGTAREEIVATQQDINNKPAIILDKSVDDDDNFDAEGQETTLTARKLRESIAMQQTYRGTQIWQLIYITNTD